MNHKHFYARELALVLAYGAAVAAVAYTAGLSAQRSRGVYGSIQLDTIYVTNRLDAAIYRDDVAELVCALVELRDASKLPDDTRLIVARALDHAAALGF